MRLEHSFEVPAPAERAWALLLDVPRVIPCLPGAELTEVVDEDTWKAKLSVKLGPIALTFGTDVRREDVDEQARRIALVMKARELRGRGGAQGTLESTLWPLDAGTRVELVTELALTGTVAQFGRPVVQDVSAQLVARFADCLRAQLESEHDGGRPATPPEPVRPVSGLSLFLRALVRTLTRRGERSRAKRA